MEANFVLNSFRNIVAAIDRAIYNLISFLYEILQILASKDIFSSLDIDSFATRVYTLLGLIMVFKVTFSLINYLVNPDLINDKTQGASNIAKNIVITLVLIIITPYLFDFGYRLQHAILNDNVLPRLILQTEETSTASLEIYVDPEVCKEPTYANSYGKYMAIMTLRPFYQFDTTVSDSSRSQDVVDKYCRATSTDELLDSDIYKADEGVMDQNNIGKYLVDYSMIWSTVAGVIVALMLLTLCMDVAVRTIKLGFLEIISPIPIISYIDPKSGKDGIFKKWYKEVIRTWASLFIKLAAIYFAIYTITVVGNSNFGSEEHGIWIMLFLILGALMFAKQFTKLIEDIFGIKVDGMSLHPIKKIQDQAMFGKQITGLGAAAGAIGLGAATNFGHRSLETARNVGKILDDGQKLRNKNWRAAGGALAGGLLKTAGSTIAGGTSAGYNAFMKTSKDGKVVNGMWQGYQTSMFSKLQREDSYRKAGLEDASVGEKLAFAAGGIKADMDRYVGVLNKGQYEYLTAAEQDAHIKDLQSKLSEDKLALSEEKRQKLEPFSQFSSYAKAIKDKIESQTVVKDAQQLLDNAVANGDERMIQERKAALDAAKVKAFTELKNSNTNIQDLISRMEGLQNANSALKGITFMTKDETTGEFAFKGKAIGDAQGEADRISRTFDDREKAFKVREEEIENIKNSEEYKTAHDENSHAKLQNASRFNKETQKAGFKPSAGPIQGTAGDSYTSGRFGGMSRPGGGPPPGGH